MSPQPPSTPSVKELLTRFTNALRAGDEGNYEHAIELTCELLQDQRIRPEDRGRFYRYLIQWSVALDNPTQARFYASQAVRELKKTLGPTHEMTLGLRSSELFWMCESGLGDIAHRRFPDLIRDVEENLDPHHELRWAVLMNAVIPLKQQGHFAQAVARYERILRSMRHRPPHNPLTHILARDNYAEVLACAGKYERSLNQYRALLEEATATFGSSDPRTLMLRNRIAAVHFDAGDDEQAWAQWQSLLPQFDEVFGPAHPESARLRSLCLLHCLEKGDNEVALAHAKALLAHPTEDSDEVDARMVRELIAHLQGEEATGEEECGAEGGSGTDEEKRLEGGGRAWGRGESFAAPEHCPCALCVGGEEAAC